MSTILDALRKLQRERTAAHPPRDLRGSVTDEIPAARPARRVRRRGPALAGIVLLLAALAGGAWLYRSGKLTRALGRGAPSVTEPAAEQPEDAAATEAALEQLERETAANDAEMDRATAAAPEAPPAVAASPTPSEPPPPAVDPEAEARAERARLEAAQAEAAAAANAQRQAEQAEAARVNPPAPPPPVVPVPQPAATASPAREAAAAVPSAPPAGAPAAPTPAPKPKAKPKPKPKPQAAKAESPPPESARREEPTTRTDDPVAAAVAVFPPVRVESIRWHPISERRVATLRFEQQTVPDAHEGDIVGGVLVYRIDPGAVEIRVGSTSRVIRPTP